MSRLRETPRLLPMIAIAALALFAAAFLTSFFLRGGDETTEPAAPCRVKIYLVGEGEECYFLVEREREVEENRPLALAAVEELIEGPEPGSMLEPAVPPSVEVLGLEVRDGTCMLDLSREFIEDSASVGPCAARERLALAAVANTLISQQDIDEVVLSIEGLQQGLVGGCHVEDLWGYCGLPEVLRWEGDLIGPPGLDKDMRGVLPAWKRIDKQALADSLGWGEISRGNTARNSVALTFDAGASGQPTPAILDALKAAGVRCTFFLTGRFVETYPELVKRMADEGHELANHSYTHPRFTEIGSEEARSQIRRTEEKVIELTGLSTRPYFRFPYGARNQSLVRFVNGEGYLSVFWTIDTLDWMPETSCEGIRSRIMRNICPGAIVLMHCGSPQEAQVLPAVIQDLEGAGYEIVTLSEALQP